MERKFGREGGFDGPWKPARRVPWLFRIAL